MNTKLREISILFLFIFFSVKINAQENNNIIASKFKVLPVPDVFATYVPDSINQEILQRNFKISRNKKSSSDVAWVVFSDRNNNPTYFDSKEIDGEEKKYIDFMEAFFVKKVKGNMLNIVKVKSKKNFDDYGWISANNLVLSRYSTLSSKGAPAKRMVLTSASDIDITNKDDVLKNLLDKNYFYSPNLESRYKSRKKASKFDILFVIKSANNGVLLSKTDKINIPKLDVNGWIDKVKTTQWNHRVCMEPKSGRGVKDRFCLERNDAGRCLKYEKISVFLEPYQLDRYFQNSQNVKRSWVLHSVPLSVKRMNANRMRYPVMPWKDKGYNKQKIAVIGEFGPDVNTSMGDNNITQESILQRRLDSILQLQENVNVMIVIDGTSSMKSYGPAVAASIKDIIEKRKLDEEKTNKKIKWGLAIYRDYADKDDKRLFEVIPITSSYQRVRDKLNKIDYGSNNKAHPEAHYYGMTEAIKQGGFKNGQSNILVLVGDAGNHQSDQNGLSKQSVIDLMYENNINLISFQVNYKTGNAKRTYQKFNSDSRSYILESGRKQINNQKISRRNYFTGLNKEAQNSFSIAYDGYGSNKNWPTFGVFNHAIMGESMNVNVFKNNLIKSFTNYMKRLDAWTKNLNSIINTDEVYGLMDEQKKINFDANLRDICDRLQLNDDDCEILKSEGQISISGFVHTTINDQKVLTEVAYMSKIMKQNIDQKLTRLAAVRSSNITKVRENFYNSMITIVQGILGENTSEEIIADYTFNEIWDIILGVPFSRDSPLRDKKISSLRSSDISNDDVQTFLATFVEEVDDFVEFPKQKDMYSSVFRKNGQDFYWIPICKVPGATCE